MKIVFTITSIVIKYESYSPCWRLNSQTCPLSAGIRVYNIPVGCQIYWGVVPQPPDVCYRLGELNCTI